MSNSKVRFEIKQESQDTVVVFINHAGDLVITDADNVIVIEKDKLHLAKRAFEVVSAVK